MENILHGSRSWMLPIDASVRSADHGETFAQKRFGALKPPKQVSTISHHQLLQGASALRKPKRNRPARLAGKIEPVPITTVRSRINNVPSTSGYHYPSLEGDYLDSNYLTGHEEPYSSSSNILPFHSRPTGPPHPGLRSIKPEKRFDQLMSYRLYLLVITANMGLSKATAEVRVLLKNLNLTLKNHTLDSTEPIRVLISLPVS